MIAPKNSLFIYFLGDVDGETIKLGRAATAAMVLNRKKSHEGFGPRRGAMKLLAVVRSASPADETWLKNYWKAQRHNGNEWIRLNPVDRAWITWLRKQSFVAINDDIDAWNALPVAAFEQWKPGRDRVAYTRQSDLLKSKDVIAMGGWSDVVTEVATGDFFSSPEMIDAARRVSGEFDLDPASERDANAVVRAKNYFSIMEDGLVNKWYGIVWINPPFNQWDFWVGKIISEWGSGRISEMYVYTSSGNTLCTKRMQPLLAIVSAIFLPYKSFKSCGPKATKSNPYANPILYLGPNVDKFEVVFREFGTVLPGASYWQSLKRFKS